MTRKANGIKVIRHARTVGSVLRNRQLQPSGLVANVHATKQEDYCERPGCGESLSVNGSVLKFKPVGRVRIVAGKRQASSGNWNLGRLVHLCRACYEKGYVTEVHSQP